MNDQFNLLPEDFQRDIRYRKHFRKGFFCFFGILSIILSASVFEYLALNNAKNELALFNSRAKPFQLMDSENHRLKEELKKRKDNTDKLQSIGNSRKLLQLLGHISHESAGLKEKIQINNFVVREKHKLINSDNTQTPETENDEQNMTLTLSGIAHDDDTISKFVSSLEATGLFKDVQLKSVAKYKISSRVIRSYEIDSVF